MADFRDFTHAKTKVVESVAKGRGVHASANLKKGTLVLAEPALSHTLKHQHAKSYCDCCLKPTKKICKACGKYAYCSVACQKKAWNSYHKVECKLLKNLDVRKLTDGITEHLDGPQAKEKDLSFFDWVIFLGRVIIGYADEKNPGFRQKIDNLCANYQQMQPSGQEHCFRISQIFAKYFGEANFRKYCTNSDITARKLLEIISALKCNMFVTTNEDLSENELCLAVYPKLAGLNHSCEPNTHLVFYNNSQATIKLSRDLKQDEEITISYCDIRQPRFYRREALSTIYCFDCDCLKCAADAKKSTDDHKHGQFTTVENIGINFRKNFDRGDFSEAESCAKFLDRKLLPSDSLIALTLHEYVFDFYLKKAERREKQVEKEKGQIMNKNAEKFECDRDANGNPYFDPCVSRIEEVDEDKENTARAEKERLEQENQPSAIYQKAMHYGIRAIKLANDNDVNSVLHGLTSLKVAKLYLYLKNFEGAQLLLKSSYDLLSDAYDEKFDSQILKAIVELRYELEQSTRN